MLTSCSDAVKELFGNGGEMEQGDAVQFTTLVPDTRNATRSARTDWEDVVRSYKAVQQEYLFDIEMWKQGDVELLAHSTYKPISSIDGGGTTVYHADGTLQNVSDPLYWQDNANRWGFRATAGTVNLETDQSDQEKWLAQDRLLGYSYLPIWEGTDAEGHATDDFNAINYRTSRQWYADNKTAKDLSGLMVESNEDYKKIPLFFQHQRSWVTIILKAGEGVEREALAYATSQDKIQTTIYSYKDGAAEPLAINAWSREELINYESDKNGEAATGVSTTRYDAVVEPHNFLAPESVEKDIIARINVSDQHFTFAAANDFNYGAYLAGSDDDAIRDMQVYNLLPGKHLTITATLSRASRLILITAWIEDWSETVTQTICDDYGQNGNPFLINNRAELIEFLTGEDNKAGNVGLVVPNSLPLDADGQDWDGSGYTLKATLNLAGATLTTKSQLLKDIDRTGSIINGTIHVTDEFDAESAVASVNRGNIERVHVTTSGELSPARASSAGLVRTNYGVLSQCSSALTVQGTAAGYVGGIAAENLFDNTVGSAVPTIEGCTVTARVDGDAAVTAGGGIVGRAEGYVSNNTFDYGVTLLQDAKFQNIIGAIGSSTQGLTNHSNNAWPTTARYTVNGFAVEIVNRNTSDTYDAVVDNSQELKELLKSAYNNRGRRYRISNSFTVEYDTWIWRPGDVLNDEFFDVSATDDFANHGTVKFELNGNDKTIALNGSRSAPMLFGSIIGEVYDLNLELVHPIVANRITSIQNGDDSNTDAIAAFAYAVTTAGAARGEIRNITLKAKNDSYIEASTPGGLVVWAMHGGTITNCASDVPVRMHITTDGVDARHYAGGIVACAQKATITQCKYYSTNGLGWSLGDDAAKAQKSNCRYGGIVGGTTEIANSEENPLVVLSDCYSWWQLPEFSQDVLPAYRPVMGGIIGSTVYHDPVVATRLYNAMAVGNAGNWWEGQTGAGLIHSEQTEEKVIGKKNGLPPTIPDGW